MQWKVNPAYLPEGVDPDDYRFDAREPYEAFRAAVAKKEFPHTVQGWIAFIDNRRALSDRAWPEIIYDDILDAEVIE